jgi:hypothetical protein
MEDRKERQGNEKAQTQEKRGIIKTHRKAPKSQRRINRGRRIRTRSARIAGL